MRQINTLITQRDQENKPKHKDKNHCYKCNDKGIYICNYMDKPFSSISIQIAYL